jgi:hypothetical protein
MTQFYDSKESFYFMDSLGEFSLGILDLISEIIGALEALI